MCVCVCVSDSAMNSLSYYIDRSDINGLGAFSESEENEIQHAIFRKNGVSKESLF